MYIQFLCLSDFAKAGEVLPGVLVSSLWQFLLAESVSVERVCGALRMTPS